MGLQLLQDQVRGDAARPDVQARASELDLFDGWRPSNAANIGSYTSIGIGDEPPSVLAALTINDRLCLCLCLCLSVLKMADATFQAYRGLGYTHCRGGGLLVPGDYRGLATLMVSERNNSSSPLRHCPLG